MSTFLPPSVVATHPKATPGGPVRVHLRHVSDSSLHLMLGRRCAKQSPAAPATFGESNGQTGGVADAGKQLAARPAPIETHHLSPAENFRYLRDAHAVIRTKAAFHQLDSLPHE